MFVYNCSYNAQHLCLRAVCFAIALAPGVAEETRLLKEMETKRKREEGQEGRKEREHEGGAQRGSLDQPEPQAGSTVSMAAFAGPSLGP